jgi:Na+/H+ antiporter NhaA
MIAFSDNASGEAAKVGILAGSFVAVVLAVIVLKTVGRTST